MWKLNADKSVEPVQIKLGITDHTTTEVAQVVKGSLNPQDQVMTGSAAANKTASCDFGCTGHGRDAWSRRRASGTVEPFTTEDTERNTEEGREILWQRLNKLK